MLPIHIQHDLKAPNATLEFPIRQPLPDYDLDEVEAAIPRDVDPMLASQGFLDLLDEARGILAQSLAGLGLEVVQLTGAICSDHPIHCPGIWLVLRETGAAPGQTMSATAKTHVAKVADELGSRLHLS